MSEPRPFPDLLNEWTDELVSVVGATDDPATIVLITQLGKLGQSLLYEANKVGMNAALELLAQARDGKRDVIAEEKQTWLEETGVKQ